MDPEVAAKIEAMEEGMRQAKRENDELREQVKKFMRQNQAKEKEARKEEEEVERERTDAAKKQRTTQDD